MIDTISRAASGDTVDTDPATTRRRGRPCSPNPKQFKVETFLDREMNERLEALRGTVPRSVFVRSLLVSALPARDTSLKTVK